MSPLLIRKEGEFWSRQLDATSVEEKRATPVALLWVNDEREPPPPEANRATTRFTLWDV
jgi:hypothetical protein